jgi:Na+/H+ antiporter NhaD/arsenite permease-like protein
MQTALVFIFVLTYGAIAFEQPLKVNKSASALIGAGLLWTVYAMSRGDHDLVNKQLAESIMKTAQIVFFLMGAMTIVEVVDAHNGFEVITSRIRTGRLTSLVWLTGFTTFFLSAVLDNLTTTIIMISLLKKLLEKRDDRLFFASIIVIAANAGGAWSPVGDVTTTMLWIGGQITTLAIMKGVFIASMLNMIVPLAIICWILRGRTVVTPSKIQEHGHRDKTTPLEQNLMFSMGLGILICVPIFKTVTHLPPFMGVLFGLGILWLTGELLHSKKDDECKDHLTLVRALRQIDMSSIVFFIGILLAVAVLEHTSILTYLAGWLTRTVGREDLIVTIIGMVSAIVDNVPLVAASMGMYSLVQYPTDSFLWQFMAYCAGTGGSILIIGSAAGVAAMGLEKIHFYWYVKRISALAMVGYFAGIVAYILQYRLMH